MTLQTPLPDGWIWTTIGDIGKLLRGVSYSKEDAKLFASSGLVPILRATNIQDENLILGTELVFVPSKYVKTEQYLKPGDIVVCMSSGSKHLVGKTAQLKQEWTGSFGTFCATIRPHPTISAKYIGYFFSSPKYRQFIREKSSGININNLKPSDFEALEIPLPLVLEQERIVAKIEELFTQLDAGTAALRRIQAGLKRYKASLLKAACEGRLVEQDPNDEPAEELLRRLGKKPLKDPDLPELPRGWCWTSWETILAQEPGSFRRGPFGSTLKKSIFVPSGYKVYEQYCPINDDCSFARYYITPELFETLKSFEVKPGDYLISCSGTLGRITRVPENSEKGIINQALLRVRINDQIVDHKFFIHYFRSRFFQDKLFDNSIGTAIPNVKGVKELKALPIPLPPVAEQRRIVSELESGLSVAAEIEETVKAALARATRLRQSILKRAFEGRLV